jgi:hypothetical protein
MKQLIRLEKVERALSLWATGAITIEAVITSRISKNKVITLKPILNKATGVVSKTPLAFNEANWGSATCGYSRSAQKNVTLERFKEVMILACRHHDSNEKNPAESCHELTDDDDDDRGNFIDLEEGGDSTYS